jgi:hypothetical protein
VSVTLAVVRYKQRFRFQVVGGVSDLLIPP